MTQAYVDGQGVLRVRSRHDDGQDEQLDVPATRYFSVVKGFAKSDEGVNSKVDLGKSLTLPSSIGVNKSEGIIDVIGEKPPEMLLVNSVVEHANLPTRKSQRSPKKPSLLLDGPAQKSMGRRKGSKSVGISKLKAVNPHIFMAYETMGEVCRVDRCGVRIISSEKMAYHQEKCHDAKTEEFVCPECPRDKQPRARSR